MARALWKASKAGRAKAEPLRSCCVCRSRRPKAELIFLNPFARPASSGASAPALQGDPSPVLPAGPLPVFPARPGQVPPGFSGPAPRGRGAWVCRAEACVGGLRQRKALDRAFRGKRTLSEGAWEALFSLASGGGAAKAPGGSG
ncbi:MAG: YlxR family protein [Deltaproteobacteria bacterium]|nr:YlxR family protein [Deltaproteobacteria bacterium]